MWCGSLRRRHRLRLAARVGDSDGVGRIIDDDRVVDVVVDDVGRRRRDVYRWIVISWNRHENWNRQNEKPKCRRRRCQHDEFRRRRRQEIYRRGRRWGEPVVRIIEHKHRPTEINYLFFRRRRHIVSDGIKNWWRFKRCGEVGKATARIGHMRASRISPKV